MLKHLTAIRYVAPLREGGSLPAIVEADDHQLYVMKFRGAGQGVKALIAELLVGEIARALGLNVPEIVLIDLDPAMGKSEPDEEIQDLLKFSVGLNLALAYLPGALMFETPAAPPPDPLLASAIVWLDAYVTNVDRTPRNANILLWQRDLWLIDHGAALYFHHAWNGDPARARKPFPYIKDHILLRFASALPEADARLTPKLDEPTLRAIVNAVPAEWLANEPGFADAQAVRDAYLTFLRDRLVAPRAFVEEAIHARAAHV